MTRVRNRNFQSISQLMSSSEGCPLLDINACLAEFTESLAWLQFDWVGSQACPHCIYRQKRDELFAAGPTPKWVSQHRTAPPAPALDKAQCMNSIPVYWYANRSRAWACLQETCHGALQLAALRPHVWLSCLIRACCPWEMTALPGWMKGWEG